MTDTISFDAKETIAFLLSRGMSHKDLLQALEELTPERVPSNTSGALPPDHYRVSVSYDPLSPFSELEKEFGKNNVSSLFDGRSWKRHASCVNMNETSGERVMLVKHFAKPMTSEEAIAWGEENGYRPAIHLEAIEFVRAYPHLQRTFWIVALGSFAMCDGYRYVAVLDGNDERRILDSCWFDYRWYVCYRFLFVRK